MNGALWDVILYTFLNRQRLEIIKHHIGLYLEPKAARASKKNQYARLSLTVFELKMCNTSNLSTLTLPKKL